MSKPIKLNSKQLRSLIKEAIEGRQPGSPLFTPPKEKIRESEALDLDIEEMVEDRLLDRWTSMYDPADPSMEAAGGEEAWNAQVQSAVNHVREQLEALITETEQGLVNGDFYGGR